MVASKSYEDLKAGKESTKDFAGCPIGNLDAQGSEATKNYSPVRSNQTISKNHDVLDPKYWFSEARELVWMSYAESRFMMAEAALRGWTTGSVDNSIWKEYKLLWIIIRLTELKSRLISTD